MTSFAYDFLDLHFEGWPLNESYKVGLRELAYGVRDFREIEDAIRLRLAIPENDQKGKKIRRFTARITGTSDPNETGWPVDYEWRQTRPTPNGYVLMPSPPALSSDTEGYGPAKNKAELLPNFGTAVGPYGQPLSLANGAALEVLPIAVGSDIIIEIEGGSSNFFARFSATNPTDVECPA